MANVKYDIDADDCVRRYRSGEPVQDIAESLDVPWHAVHSRLAYRGVEFRGNTAESYRRSGQAQRIDLPVDDIVARYKAGESENALASAYDVSRNVIRRRLEDREVDIRGQSEAEAVKWSRMTPEERRAQVAAAHEASEGRRATWRELVSRAHTIMADPINVGEGERVLADLLTERGVDPIPQFAVGPYNCDLALFPIAVEVFGGTWHWTGDHARRDPERVRYLMDHGWHVAIVTDRIGPISGEVADYLVAWFEEARSDPTSRREYRMVGGDGELILSGTEDDNVSLEWPFTNGVDPSTGRYVRVPDDA